MSPASRPATPSAKAPTSRAEERFEDKGYPVEWAELYRPGGFHPIHLGDTLREGRYRVIRKLGYGSFSTVWLAIDTAPTQNSTFVALKVGMSKDVDSAASELKMCAVVAKASKEETPGSDHIIQLIDSFQEQGPNGTHIVLVYPPMAGTVASTVEQLPQNLNSRRRFPPVKMRYPKWMAKRILKHTLLGLYFLHGQGIVHGDLQPGNLLFSTCPLAGLQEADLSQDEEVVKKPLVRQDGKTDLWAPRYLALDEQLYKFANLGPGANIKISDLGAAFFKDKPPAKIVTPVALRAPETILEQPMDENIDIWSFGCLLYELITGTQLFGVFMMGDDKQEDADDDHLLEMHDILGPLPDNIMALWPRARDWFGPNGERLNPRAGKREEDWDGSEWKGRRDDEDSDDDVEEEELYINKPLEALFEENKPDDVDEEEAGVITALIRRILRYDAAERPSAAEILQEKWFEDDDA